MPPGPSAPRLVALLLAAGLAACSGDAPSDGAATTDRPPSAAPFAAPSAPPPEPNYGQNASGGVNAPRHRDAPYVVMVSFDGFRPDYLERHPTPWFDRLAERGVRAERMIPAFPTKTFPSHYSLATGLYAENHGLVGNTFRDPRREGRYSIRDRSAVEDSSWYGGEPLWVTAERQGMVAAAYYWIGTEAAVQGIRPTFWYRFTEEVPGEARVDRIVEWLALPPEHRPHLVMAYFSETDVAGHDHGPDSPELAAAVARVDALLGRLVRGVDALPHGDRVTYVLVSDHGMASYGRDDLVVLDTGRLPDVEIVESGPYASVFVPGADPERLRAVRDTLRRMVADRADVYLRGDVPERLHFSAHPAVGDLVLVARGTAMLVPRSRAAAFRPGHTHGWDNRMPEMGALFLAAGPRLPADTVIGPFEAVHVYPLVTEILGLEPADVDGRLGVLGPLLRGERAPEGEASAVLRADTN